MSRRPVRVFALPEVNVRQRVAPSGVVRVWASARDALELGLDLRIEEAVNETCPWSGKPIAADSLTHYAGAVVGFCNPGCRDKFERAVGHFEAALAARRLRASGEGSSE